MPQESSSLLEQFKQLKQLGQIRHNPDVTLATAIVLLEVASSDEIVDRFERGMIHNGLKQLFDISDARAAAAIGEAQNHLRNMRSSATEASFLRDILDPISKRAVMQLIDKLINMDGAVSGMEIYLRNRFKNLLGLPTDS
jgi:uncharacterized tellurite resistance protein B-like protein